MNVMTKSPVNIQTLASFELASFDSMFKPVKIYSDLIDNIGTIIKSVELLNDDKIDKISDLLIQTLYVFTHNVMLKLSINLKCHV